MFYDKPEGNIIFGLPGISLLNSIAYQTPTSSPWQLPAKLGTITPMASIAAVDPNMVVARTTQFSFGVQQELPYGLMLDTTYVGM